MLTNIWKYWSWILWSCNYIHLETNILNLIEKKHIKKLQPTHKEVDAIIRNGYFI